MNDTQKTFNTTNIRRSIDKTGYYVWVLVFSGRCEDQFKKITDIEINLTYVIVSVISGSDDFRCHIFDGATKAISSFFMGKKLFGKAEVGEDYVAVAVQ